MNDTWASAWAGAGDISKFFMLCIPIATEILGQVPHPPIADSQAALLLTRPRAGDRQVRLRADAGGRHEVHLGPAEIPRGPGAQGVRRQPQGALHALRRPVRRGRGLIPRDSRLRLRPARTAGRAAGSMRPFVLGPSCSCRTYGGPGTGGHRKGWGMESRATQEGLSRARPHRPASRHVCRRPPNPRRAARRGVPARRRRARRDDHPGPPPSPIPLSSSCSLPPVSPSDAGPSPSLFSHPPSPLSLSHTPLQCSPFLRPSLP
jgi:hypothetical protein